MRVDKALVVIGIVAVTAAMLGSDVALAQPQSPATPRGWNYELRDGKRVPRPGNRVTKRDGSWREEQRQGNCVTVKEMSKSGEYKETRQCNPQG
jgi:hypothetical protein